MELYLLGGLIVGLLLFSGRSSNRIICKLERLMAQVDDLRAAVQAVGDGMNSVDLKLDEVLVSVQAVIALLSQPNPDVQAAITSLQTIATQAGAVQTEAQGIKDVADAALPPPVPAGFRNR